MTKKMICRPIGWQTLTGGERWKSRSSDKRLLIEHKRERREVHHEQKEI